MQTGLITVQQLCDTYEQELHGYVRIQKKNIPVRFYGCSAVIWTAAQTRARARLLSLISIGVMPNSN